jgi:hypothetical protein
MAFVDEFPTMVWWEFYLRVTKLDFTPIKQRYLARQYRATRIGKATIEHASCYLNQLGTQDQSTLRE